MNESDGSEVVQLCAICDNASQNQGSGDSTYYQNPPDIKQASIEDLNPIETSATQIEVYDDSRHGLYQFTDGAHFVKENDSVASVVSACNDEILEMHSMLQKYWSSSVTAANSLSSVNKLVFLNVQTQLFGLRKACTLMKASTPP